MLSDFPAQEVPVTHLKGGGDSSGKATAPEVVVPKVAVSQGHQVNPSAPSPAPVPRPDRLVSSVPPASQ